jgi:hypothetical protein
MKKTFTTLSVIAGNVAIALAQVQGQITIGQTASAGQINGGPLLSLLALAQKLVSNLVPFMVSLAVLAFFWFLIEFIWKGGDDGEAKKRSLTGMGYSILAIFVMVSIWGIIGLIGYMSGVGQGGDIPIPRVPSAVN